MGDDRRVIAAWETAQLPIQMEGHSVFAHAGHLYVPNVTDECARPPGERGCGLLVAALRPMGGIAGVCTPFGG